MGATTQPHAPRRPTLVRRLAAALALTAVLLLGAMSTVAVAAPRTAPAVNKDIAPAAQPLPTPRPSSAVLPLFLGGIIMLALITPIPIPWFYPRFGYRGRRY